MPTTDPSHHTEHAIHESQDRFIALWGQMGTNWGIPRSMAEVHALLFIAGRPLNTDEVMNRLGISRGSASTTLRALVEWQLVTRVHVRGDRKEYFEGERDIWRMFRLILRQRKKREIDPVLEELHACRALTDVQARRVDAAAAPLDAHNQRLDDLLEFMQMLDSLSQRFVSPSGKGLELAAKLLARAS